MALNLMPFGFTPTESLVYGTLLRLGPSTGYAVARGSRLARANAYSALEGLVTRGAATRTPALNVLLATDPRIRRSSWHIWPHSRERRSIGWAGSCATSRVLPSR